jgi:hypothetical protein
MKTILIQLDTDPQPSSFDRVVAVDAGVEELFCYGGVAPESVEPLVHGAMFTRGPADLKQTAIFIGGSDVASGERLLERVRKTFFGPIRVSVMMDSNGSNTTAAAAVLSAKKHLGTFAGVEALVLAGTGPVGQRAAQLLAAEGAAVRVASRVRDRAAVTCDAIASQVSDGKLSAWSTANDAELRSACEGVQLVIAAGAAGVTLLPTDVRWSMSSLRVAIDLNAVPPLGIAGVDMLAKAVERDGAICYGAIGVGGLKMKIHKAALRRLFESNDQVLDTAAIYQIGQQLS